MTIAIIGTGGIGSIIARLLAAGGEAVRLSSASPESARKLAGEIGPAAAVLAGNRDALRGAGTVVRLLPAGQSSGQVVAGWLPAGARLAMAFGSMSGELLESPATGRRRWPPSCAGPVTNVPARKPGG